MCHWVYTWKRILKIKNRVGFQFFLKARGSGETRFHRAYRASAVVWKFEAYLQTFRLFARAIGGLPEKAAPEIREAVERAGPERGGRSPCRVSSCHEGTPLPSPVGACWPTGTVVSHCTAIRTMF